MSISPFTYGKPVAGHDFIGRSEEIDSLSKVVLDGSNILILAPDGWGKTSLVKKTLEDLARHGHRFRHIHLDFYNAVSPEAIRKETDRLPLEKERGSVVRSEKTVVSIKNFSRILRFENGVAVARNILDGFRECEEFLFIFLETTEVGLYIRNNCRVFNLRSIPEEIWSGFIRDRFTSSGKAIQSEACRLLVKNTEGNPYYTQMLSLQVWNKTMGFCTKATIEEAVNDLLQIYHLQFDSLTSALTPSQVSILKAIIHKEHAMTSKETMSKYGFASSPAVNRARGSVIEKGIIYKTKDSFCFVNPFYRLWLTERYFRLP